jgi:DNA-binding response OmpR family regulator
MAVKPRVLVIDDDPLFRSLLAGLLKTNYAVTTAESGSQGYELALDRPPHVALVDVQMPGWNGLETMRKFREHEVLSRTRLAILSADASRETVVTAIRGGADEYIVKTNFYKEELLRKLRALVEKSTLPIEDEEDSPASLRPDKPGQGKPAPAARAKENEGNPKLQEMIDDWE